MLFSIGTQSNCAQHCFEMWALVVLAIIVLFVIFEIHKSVSFLVSIHLIHSILAKVSRRARYSSVTILMILYSLTFLFSLGYIFDSVSLNIREEIDGESLMIKENGKDEAVAASTKKKHKHRHHHKKHSASRSSTEDN